MMKRDARKSPLELFIEWREKHVPQSQFILILSFLVGVISSLAAFVLKHIIEFIQHMLTGKDRQDSRSTRSRNQKEKRKFHSIQEQQFLQKEDR